MNGNFVLDTSIVVALLRGEEEIARRINSEAVAFVPSIVLGELYYGARRSKRVAENVAEIDAFAAGVTILPIDRQTAVFYSLIKNELSARGQPIPENDIWIAAIVKQHGLTLVSRDAHFDAVDELYRETW